MQSNSAANRAPAWRDQRSRAATISAPDAASARSNAQASSGRPCRSALFRWASAAR
jgi:hypothetical protein